MAISDEPKPVTKVKASAEDALAWLKINWPRYWEVGLYALFAIVAAGFRFWDLGARSFNHDESLHAQYSWYLYNGPDGYDHDPMMHGPFQFHFNALIFRALEFLSAAPILSNWVHWGPSDYSARMLPAIFGVALVVMPYFLRGYIGRFGALMLSLFFVFSPVLLYFSRFARNDIYIGVWTLAIIICIWRYMTEHRNLYLYITAAVLALSFATKEVTFMTAALFLVYLELLLAWELLSQMRSGVQPVPVVEEDDAGGKKRRKKQATSLPPPKAKDDFWRWALTYAALIPFAWLIAIIWPLITGWRKRQGLTELPASADLLLVIGTLSAVQFAAAVQALPFIGNKGYYREADEETLMKVSVFLLLALSGYIGIAWRARTWLVCAAIFYAIFVVLYTTLFTNVNSGDFLSIHLNQDWAGVVSFLFLAAFVVPAVSLLWSTHPRLTTAAVILYGVFVFVNVVVLTNTGFWSGIWGSLDYWLAQQGVERGSQPWYYYLMILPMYEFLPLVFALVGGVYFLVKRDVFTMFLIFWAIGSVIAFVAAGEKMPWLAVHQVIPIMLLAVKLLDALFRRFRITLPFDWRNPEVLVLLAAVVGALSMILLWLTGFSFAGAMLALLLGFAGVALVARAARRFDRLWAAQAAAALIIPALFVFTVRDAVRASFDIPKSEGPREMLFYAETSPDMPMARDTLVELGNRTELGNAYPVVVDNELAWPMVWYLRDFTKVQWASEAMAPPVQGSLVILDKAHEAWMEPYLDNYNAPISIRHLWWFGDGPQYYEKIGPGEFVKSLFKSKTWDIWRDYFVFRDLPWPPPADDSLLYIPLDDRLATASGVTLNAPPPLPMVTAPAGSYLTLGGGQLTNPTDVSMDAAGNFYVADAKSNSIIEFSRDGKVLRTLEGGEAEGSFVQPWSVAVDKDGSVYVSDTWHDGANGRIVKYDANFKLVWATDPSVLNLYGPRDILALPDGSILVADTGNNRIIRLGSNGALLGTYGKKGSQPGEFNEPVSLALGPNSEIYVADTWNGRVQRFDASFKYLGEFKVRGWGSQDATAKPFLVVLPDGRVIISSPANSRIELYDSKGSAVVGWELPAQSSGAKGRPVGMTLDSTGYVFVADYYGGSVFGFPIASLVLQQASPTP